MKIAEEEAIIESQTVTVYDAISQQVGRKSIIGMPARILFHCSLNTDIKRTAKYHSYVLRLKMTTRRRLPKRNSGNARTEQMAFMHTSASYRIARATFVPCTYIFEDSVSSFIDIEGVLITAEQPSAREMLQNRFTFQAFAR